MPKQTFFNLPKEKQGILIHSVKKEFSRVPLNEASISNIVKYADIPRGSFYQYFKDKEDAFYYLLALQANVYHSEFILILKRSKGDIFDAFMEMFRNMLIGFQEENQNFFKNVFLNMNYKMENKLIKGFKFSKDDCGNELSNILTHINIKKINISNEQELFHVMQIIIAVTFQNLMNNFAKKYSYDEAIEKYKTEIDLLKKGLYRDNTNE